MLDGAYNRRFVTIKTYQYNKMMCGSYSYPKSKDKTVGLINNYHVSKQNMFSTPVK